MKHKIGKRWFTNTVGHVTCDFFSVLLFIFGGTGKKI